MNYEDLDIDMEDFHKWMKDNDHIDINYQSYYRAYLIWDARMKFRRMRSSQAIGVIIEQVRNNDRE